MHEAARSGESDMLKWLISHSSIDVNVQNDAGENALIEAANMGHTDAMWTLIRAGASLGAPGSHQSSSLFHHAVKHANVDVLNLMQEKGAITTSEIQHPDSMGRVALIEAVGSGQDSEPEP